MKLTEERITELVSVGFKRWQKNGYDRLYINASALGLSCEYYHTGNIRDAIFGDCRISNCEARRMKAAKTYIDVMTGTVHSDNRLLKEAAEKLAGIEKED